MDNVDQNIDDIKNYIIDKLNIFRTDSSIINNVRFHHNTSYKNASLVCEYGILSLLDLNKVGIRNDSRDTLERLDDVESHINGTSGVSLARVGLNDLYEGEAEYDPFDSSKVDFTISSDVKAYRNSRHYGNEYICSNSIEPSKILTVDVRILEYINICNKKEDLIEMYNSLIEMAKVIKEKNLNISLREMSYDNNFSIDINKIALSKKIDC